MSNEHLLSVFEREQLLLGLETGIEREQQRLAQSKEEDAPTLQCCRYALHVDAWMLQRDLRWSAETSKACLRRLELAGKLVPSGTTDRGLTNFVLAE